MAKKKGKGSSGFNMAAAIRDVLEGSPELSGRECREAVQKNHPKEDINPNSFGVAFSNARKKLGISRKGGKKSVRRRTPNSSAANVNIEVLRAAKDLLSVAKDSDTAISAIKQLQSLQVS